VEDEFEEKKYWNKREHSNKGKLLWVLLGVCILITSLLAAFSP